MDYAELNRKFAYTAMDNAVRPAGAPAGGPLYQASADPIASDEDMDDFRRSVLSDFRPDPRTLESDQKQTRTDSVSFLRFRYHGTRAGDDPDYHKEMFLEMTEKDPRRSMTDPDFRQSVKQGWARQLHYKQNLYPDDPGTGSITSGQLSPFGLQQAALAAREAEKPRVAGVLIDTLDGTEPRRMWRFDSSSFIDRALANQGDLPFVPQDHAGVGATQRGLAQNATTLSRAKANAWAHGDTRLQTAQLGRGTRGRLAAPGDARAGAGALGEAARAAPTTDAMGATGATAAPLSGDSAAANALRSLVDGAMAAYMTTKSDAATSQRGGGVAWGSVTEHVRKAVDQTTQDDKRRLANGDERQVAVRRGATDPSVGGASERLAATASDVAANNSLAMAARFQEMFYRRAAGEVVGPDIAAMQTEISKMVERHETNNTARPSGATLAMVDLRRAMDMPVGEKSMVKKASKRVVQYGRRTRGDRGAQPFGALTAELVVGGRDAVGAAVGRGRLAKDPAAAQQAAGTSAEHHDNAAAAAGLQGGAVGGALGAKQHAKFRTDDVRQLGEDTLFV